MEYNEPMTTGRLKEALKNIPDSVAINVLNEDGDKTANIYVWFENLETRKFVELMGFKPFYKMTNEEKKKCGYTGSMKELEYNESMTVGGLKEALKNIPDNVAINVLNKDGESTANIYVWFENLETRQFVELMGFKPFYKMTDEEKKKCGSKNF